MSFVSLLLEIYTESAQEEVLLPDIQNTDFESVLSKSKFGAAGTVRLELENIEGRWRFKPTNTYTIEKQSEHPQDRSVEAGDIFKIYSDRLTFSVLVSERSPLIGAYEKFETATLRSVTVGKDEQCDVCYSVRRVISRRHLTVRLQGRSAVLEDTSVNGVYVNGHRVRGQMALQFGDVVYVFGLKLVYLVDAIAINVRECGATIRDTLRASAIAPTALPTAAPTVAEQPEVLFNRSPRKIKLLHTDPEEIEAPPQKPVTTHRPWWAVIGPSFTMAIPMLLGTGFMVIARNLMGTNGNLFMYVGLVTSVSSAIIGVTWAIINLRQSKKEEKEAELHRLQRYSEYLLECAQRISAKYEYNRGALLKMYPDARTCGAFWKYPQELWNRNPSHADFLTCRLGLGSVPFQVPIVIPKKKFMLHFDELASRPGEIKDAYSTLYDAPITIDFNRHRVVGIVGPERADIARVIITQMAASACYTDLRMAFLGDESTGTDWTYMKWLPHVWSADRSQRYVALHRSEVNSVCYELMQVFRTAGGDGANRSAVMPPQYLVVSESAELLKSEPITKYLFENPQTTGVITLILSDAVEHLPNACDFVIEKSARYSGMYSLSPQETEPACLIQFDQVSLRRTQLLARRISGIRVAENGVASDLPDTLTFLQMYDVSSVRELNVLDNWRKNRTYQTMQALIGQKVGGQPCYLNIHEKHHGPHGLVAGTTGSGKSETLQTYILSLAIHYSPQDVGFFIIDFKGGGMAHLFDGLPHMLGSISNLSGNQVRRAMVSIQSENKRRQRLFNEYGVNHIDAYTKLVKAGEANTPIPHLFIIIDEFAELKREQPEFMRELISVAQVGRSLGVHLILATQKPSGTVDDNIWSNTKFRLCLRVADTQDSKDMLHKPDAAYITQAGRCYMQVGNDEIYELFQSGWSGAVYDEESSQTKGAVAVQLENSGKVVMTGSSTRAKKLMRKKLQWIAQLVRCCRPAMEYDTEEAVLDAVFARLKQQGLNYADSAFNRRQLRDFIRRYHALFDHRPEDAAKQILREAEASGHKLPEQKEKTQLDAVVEYVKELAEANGFVNHLRLWMPVLPERLLLSELAGVREAALTDAQWNAATTALSLSATVGMVDDPQNQSQYPLTVDFLRDGHLAVCGAVSSGKSVLMQTIAYSLMQNHTPDMLNLYIVDYSGQMLTPFEAAPHTGGVVCEGETEKLDKLFMLLRQMLKERKAMFRGGSFTQYIQSHGHEVPSVVLMIDGYAAFREKTDNAYEAALMELARDGAGFGIFLCLSSGGFGTGEIQAKLGDKIRQVLTLEMDSKYSYGECLRTMHFDVLPETGVRGRGLALCGESVLEYQTALAADGDDYQRSEHIRSRALAIADLYRGKGARRIPEVPKDPTWELFVASDEYRRLLKTGRFLPLGYRREDASVYAVDLAQTYCYQITGRESSGKSVFLRNIACAAKDLGATVYMVDRMGQTTESRTAQQVDAIHVCDGDQLFEMWKTVILTINERHTLYKQWMEQGLEPEELFVRMQQYKPMVILVADLLDFAQACANPGNGKPSMTAQADNILTKGALHGVYFFGVSDTQDLAAASLQSLHRSFTKNRHGVHLGGELNTQKMLSYRNIPFAEQTRVLKPGIGYVPSEEDAMNVDQIIIPMNKGLARVNAPNDQ